MSTGSSAPFGERTWPQSPVMLLVLLMQELKPTRGVSRHSCTHLKNPSHSAWVKAGHPFLPPLPSGKRVVYYHRQTEKNKTKIKSELWGESAGGCSVGRKGSGTGLEVAGFRRRERSGLIGRRKGGKTGQENGNKLTVKEEGSDSLENLPEAPRPLSW